MSTVGVVIFCVVLSQLNPNLSDFLALQNIFSLALGPTYLYGMYWDAVPHWLAAGSVGFGALIAAPVHAVAKDEWPAAGMAMVVINFVGTAAIAQALSAARSVRPGSEGAAAPLRRRTSRRWRAWSANLDPADALAAEAGSPEASWTIPSPHAGQAA